ncbi:MAG TPA: Asp-tRNA(Asn)/Glu-tRNA(Gln) amidotransferase subunit GatC [Candidatus Pacebacteria bacterium]|nr:Asp-tRNA(Asn)/Glu-tRNA(Gln) amidotransferase subunit GatC [Candidatus Paceibacterota bacterium]
MTELKKITPEEVKRFAELSRIKISDEEAIKYSRDFDDIIPFISQISEMEVLENVVRDFKNVNTLREDEIIETNNQKEIISEMPDTKDNYLKVKKILNN